MKINKNIATIFLLIVLILAGCTPDSQNDNYVNEILKWKHKRDSSLTKPTGWLSVAGLYWLEQGENTFGSDSTNQFIFPAKAPKFMGSFVMDGTTVSVKINDNVDVFVDSSRINKMVLKNDNEKGTHLLKHGSLSWYVLKRSEKIGIRLRDSEHPNIKSFKGIDHFPIVKEWRIKARLEPFDSIKTIRIANVLGQISDFEWPGTLVFEIDGQTHKLDPIISGKRYWLLFADETSGEETYGAGRFLYTDKVDSTGYTYIDFNKSYNPPCVFTPFATCPLPPLQNRLSVRITAGEKNWGIH
ncbi:MAG: DUF1684 domain-containing protein [Calditrichaeota bacterium]|nr:MAG: DUF1684 domain-containing protein [Calditrichota bacterium]MBL1207663.1 DUF1684 domain-containing protein [Calditrichota bacterium]NOG47496.1 DUF1684 domain-containing protein [Calditrichota bacterium]